MFTHGYILHPIDIDLKEKAYSLEANELQLTFSNISTDDYAKQSLTIVLYPDEFMRLKEIINNHPTAHLSINEEE